MDRGGSNQARAPEILLIDNKLRIRNVEQQSSFSAALRSTIVMVFDVLVKFIQSVRMVQLVLYSLFTYHLSNQ